MRPALAIARMRWGILERGISGDIDAELPAAERTDRTVRVLAEYVQEMAKARWPELLPMALTVLQDLAKSEGEGKGEGDGKDEHLGALEHFRVPDQSQGDEDNTPDQQEQVGPPDCQSDALAGEYLEGLASRQPGRMQQRLLDHDGQPILRDGAAGGRES